MPKFCRHFKLLRHNIIHYRNVEKKEGYKRTILENKIDGIKDIPSHDKEEISIERDEE